jgi:hypothetical protein
MVGTREGLLGSGFGFYEESWMELLLGQLRSTDLGLHVARG